MKKQSVPEIRKRALKILKRARIVLSSREQKHLAVTDFGLGDIKRIGIQTAFSFAVGGFSAREIALLPGQIFPEHKHIVPDPRASEPREIVRCRWGEVFLYTEGKPSKRIRAHVPFKYRDHFSVWKQHVMKPGDQVGIAAETLHWYQAGSKGAVVSEYAGTRSELLDVWTDPSIANHTGDAIPD